MSKQFSVAGITFAIKDNPALLNLRPVGAVSFVREPDNAFDKNAVRIDLAGVKLGYIPKGHFQDTVIESGITVGKVADYSYRDGKIFNNDHKGQLGSISISFEDGSEDDAKAGGRIAGGKYMRVTSFISYFDAYGGGDGLIKWAMTQVQEFFASLEEITLSDLKDLILEPEGLYNIYKRALNLTADKGTLMHGAIEGYLEGKREFFRINISDLSVSNSSLWNKYSIGGTDGVLELPIDEWQPAGWAHFIDTYEIDVCYMEERFFDNELMVCGQPDLVCFIRERKKKDAKLSLMVLDWKSSKKPSIKHKIQISIYAKNVQWDGQKVDAAVIVAFGSPNKKGYATSKVTAEQIENNYLGMKHLRKAVDLMAPTYNM